jgi:hypothetical protein
VISQERKQILEELGRLSELAPDMRFGQTVANLASLALGPKSEAVWDVEDGELLVALRRLIANLSEMSPEDARACGVGARNR